VISARKLLQKENRLSLSLSLSLSFAAHRSEPALEIIIEEALENISAKQGFYPQANYMYTYMQKGWIFRRVFQKLRSLYIGSRYRIRDRTRGRVGGNWFPSLQSLPLIASFSSKIGR